MNNKKYLILDTETANFIENPLCYDISFAVMDSEGNIYDAHQFVVAEIFLDTELMTSAYYAEKKPRYWDKIKEGRAELKRLANVRKILWETMSYWGIDTVIAHNARFDYSSCTTTQRYLTCSKYRNFFPKGTKYFDTLLMARRSIAKTAEYKAFCEENGYKTATGRDKLTAEVLYRYISGKNEFIEEHQGLEDIMIEKEIFVACRKLNPEVDGELFKKSKPEKSADPSTPKKKRGRPRKNSNESAE